MAPIRVLLARGAGNNLGDSFCWLVANLLDKSIFTIREIPYYAEIVPVGGPHTMEQSMDNFDALATKELEARVPWMGIGYSLGAAALNRYVGTKALSMCKGIGQLSDPRRHSTQYMGKRKPPGYGVAGGYVIGRPGGFPVWSYTAPNDPISEARPAAGIRYIAGLIGAPGAAIVRPEAILPGLQDHGLIMDLINYGPAGRHTCYPGEKFEDTGKTYVQHLADQMNAEGRRLTAAGVV